MSDNMDVAVVVEDEMIFRLQLTRWLTDLGFKVFEAESAERGSFLVTEKQPDLVFLDNLLPGVLGSDAVSIYKETCRTSRVILMSSMFDVEDIAKGIQGGADFLLDKEKISKQSITQLISVITDDSNRESSLWRLLRIFDLSSKESEHKNVAIIEDEELFSFHLSYTLNNSDHGNRVHSFSTAESFKDYATRTNPDVIFLDFFMPNSNGEELLAYIKKNHEDAEVVIITSLQDPEVALRLNEMGIANFIMKDEFWHENLLLTMQKLGL